MKVLFPRLPLPRTETVTVITKMMTVGVDKTGAAARAEETSSL
jgi:hypothetical protein